MARYEIEGLQEMVRNLERLHADLAENATIKALTSGSKVLAEGARRRAPDRSGTLKEGIGYAVGGGPKTRTLRRVRPEVGEAAVGSDTFYATFVNDGTATTPSNDFFDRAIVEEQSNVIDAMGDTLEEYIAAWKAN